MFPYQGLPARLYKTSSTWMDDRAAFVHTMEDSGEWERLEDDANERWMAIW